MSWMLTYTGNRFDPASETNEFDIVDIAHALSNIARFGGHTEKLYSVAQHSVIVSGVLQAMGCSAWVQLEGLLHDATEAYMVDVPQPIKCLPCMNGYRDLEAVIATRIYRAFGIEHQNPATIKQADLVALASEARDLMGDPRDWPSIANVQPIAMKVIPLAPAEAKALFLERFLELSKKVDA